MGFLQDFEDDVFISYSSTDDEPLFGSAEGWVTRLHRDLETRLKQLLGNQLSVWLDQEQLQGNDELTPTLVDQLRKSGVLLTIVSPPYLDSTWCMKELHFFCLQASESGRLRVQNKSRLFKVVKTPVDRNRQPAEMRDLVSFEFYEKQKTGATLEYNWEYGDKKKYAFKVNDLAYGIANFLRLLSGQLQAFTPKATVYLAHATPDLREQREELWRDLLQRGFALLPEEALSPEDPGFEEKVRAMMRRCQFSVHLLGQEYGDAIAGRGVSLPEWEASLAEERCSEPDFERVIWLPPGVRGSDPREQQLLEFLQNDPGAQQGTELLETKIEDLKTFLEEWTSHKEKRRRAPQKPAASPATAAAKRGPLRVYLMADEQDVAGGTTTELEDYFFNQGIEVLVSQQGQDETQTRELHYDNLRLCDACMIFWGQGSPLWMEAKRNDMRKIVDARSDPARAKVIYVAAPDNDAKKKFRTLEATVVRGQSGFSPAALAQVVEQLRSKPK